MSGSALNDIEVRQRIGSEFGLPPDCSLTGDLIDEGRIDSLQMMELVSFIEELAGLGPGQAPREYPLLATLQDAIDYYKELVEESGTTEERSAGSAAGAPVEGP